MTTYYVDNVSGDDANNGTASGTPKKTWQAIHNIGLVGGTDTLEFTSDGSTAYTVPNSTNTLTLDSGTATASFTSSDQYSFALEGSGSVGGSIDFIGDDFISA